MSKTQIAKLERVDLREVWRHEARDFTQWLEDNIATLNEALELDLVNVEREQAAGAFSIDLVAEDSGGGTVIIENQLEKSNHDHLGKLMTYLSAMDAKAAIWIVSEPRPEHVAAITWLNEGSSAAFYMVEARDGIEAERARGRGAGRGGGLGRGGGRLALGQGHRAGRDAWRRRAGRPRWLGRGLVPRSRGAGFRGEPGFRPACMFSRPCLPGPAAWAPWPPRSAVQVVEATPPWWCNRLPTTNRRHHPGREDSSEKFGTSRRTPLHDLCGAVGGGCFTTWP